jgi:hypothetical protein
VAHACRRIARGSHSPNSEFCSKMSVRN